MKSKKNVTSITSQLAGPRKGPGRANEATQHVVVLFHPHTSDDASKARVYTIEFDCSTSLTIEAIIHRAHALGATRGDRAMEGVFEVQLETGVWSTPNGTRLLTVSGSRLVDDASFSSTRKGSKRHA